MKDYMRVRAEIDLDAVIFNLESIHRHLPEKNRLFAVVKTDAYGHGAAEIASEIEKLPYLCGFCVATAEEGASLRASGIQKKILILGYTFPESYELLLENNLTPTVFTVEAASELDIAAGKRGMTLPVHIAVDTGMSRIGLQTDEEGIRTALSISSFPHLYPEGIFTHFARADERDKTATREQYALFRGMIDELNSRGLCFSMIHCANSAAIMELPEMAEDASRAGIILYGLLPSEEMERNRLPLRPVMSLRSHVAYVKELSEGRKISYGGTYEVHGTKKIATIPVGYGDGYPRSLSGCGYVLIHGKKAPICGRVCMDQFMVDVTEIENVCVSDEVTLLGTQGERSITMEELDVLSGRLHYELACDIGKRVPRVFFRNGKPLSAREPL